MQESQRECQNIEQSYLLDQRNMYSRIKDVCKRKTCSTSGCIKSKEGQIITDKDKIIERWAEYIGELYDDDRPQEKPIINNFDGPPILKEEIEYAIRKMKRGKAAGPDDITVELLEALGEIETMQLTQFLNDIYEKGHIPKDLTKSIFIALPKKPGAVECELHRTISLMSHITKVLLRILMNRARNKISPEISAEQCGFVAGKGTANAIYILRNVIERSLEVQKDVYLCFIDYAKAFDRVKHCKILEILEELDIDGKDLKLIRNIYWDQTAAVKIENEISAFQNIKRGVRQGCVFSPDLFSIYSEKIMRHIENMPGIEINGRNVNNVRYADDTVLIAEKECDLQNMVDVIVRESDKMGLDLNAKKTEVMVVTRYKERPKCNIKVNQNNLSQVESFKYLGTMITSDGRSDTEIKSRIGQAKTAFQNMRHVLVNKEMPDNLKRRIFQCYVEPIMLYACETWTMNADTKRKIEAAEMWFIRRMLRVSWTERKTNEDVLKEANTKRKLLNKIRKRQGKFFGHIMRQESLEKLVTTGKINGKRGQGKQRIKMLDSLTTWLGKDKGNETIRATEDRTEWRAIIANASQHGT